MTERAAEVYSSQGDVVLWLSVGGDVTGAVVGGSPVSARGACAHPQVTNTRTRVIPKAIQGLMRTNPYRIREPMP